MASAQQDTEITLGTGRMLALFFTLVLVCALFFAIGFSLGRRTSSAVLVGPSGVGSAAPATVVRPSAAKNDASQANDFTFYKAVGEKPADTLSKPTDARSQPAPVSAVPPSPEPPKDASNTGTGSGYSVQVAAVSRQEDAEALVDSLKKKQYPAFSTSNPSVDKFFHVQVGPYAELKDAEAMRTRLIADGYNPIVKK